MSMKLLAASCWLLAGYCTALPTSAMLIARAIHGQQTISYFHYMRDALCVSVRYSSSRLAARSQQLGVSSTCSHWRCQHHPITKFEASHENSFAQHQAVWKDEKRPVFSNAHGDFDFCEHPHLRGAHAIYDLFGVHHRGCFLQPQVGALCLRRGSDFRDRPVRQDQLSLPCERQEAGHHPAAAAVHGGPRHHEERKLQYHRRLSQR